MHGYALENGYQAWNKCDKEAVEEIEKEGEERRLVFEFETKHRDEMDEILGVIDYIDKGYVKERFPEVYKFGCERLGIHFEDKFATCNL